MIGRQLALVGARTCRLHEALLLRSYTADLTVLTLDRPWELTAGNARSLTEAGITIVEDPVHRLAVGDDSLIVDTGDGRPVGARASLRPAVRSGRPGRGGQRIAAVPVRAQRRRTPHVLRGLEALLTGGPDHRPGGPAPPLRS